jgi:hypothetical protein
VAIKGRLHNFASVRFPRPPFLGAQRFIFGSYPRRELAAASGTVQPRDDSRVEATSRGFVYCNRARRLSRGSLESWYESRVRLLRERQREREREVRALERAGATAHKALDRSPPSSEKRPVDRAELVVSLVSRAYYYINLRYSY